MDFPIFLLSGYFFVLLLLFSCILVYLCCRKFNGDELLIVEGGNFQPTSITERHCCHQINRKRGCQLTSNASYRKIEFTYSAPLMNLKTIKRFRTTPPSKVVTSIEVSDASTLSWTSKCLFEDFYTES